MAGRIDVEKMSVIGLKKEVTRLRKETDRLKEELEDAIKKRNVMMRERDRLKQESEEARNATEPFNAVSRKLVYEENKRIKVQMERVILCAGCHGCKIPTRTIEVVK